VTDRVTKWIGWIESNRGSSHVILDHKVRDDNSEELKWWLMIAMPLKRRKTTRIYRTLIGLLFSRRLHIRPSLRPCFSLRRWFFSLHSLRGWFFSLRSLCGWFFSLRGLRGLFSLFLAYVALSEALGRGPRVANISS